MRNNQIMRPAGKNRTFFKRLDLLPSKLPCLVELQWELSTICDSTHGAFSFAVTSPEWSEWNERPALAEATARQAWKIK